MAEQTKLFFWNNQNLFSNNYLEHHLPTTALWTEQRKKIKDIFETVKKVYETIQSLKPGQGQEAELEDKFIRPVLTALGYEYNVQPPTHRGFKKKRPDYALFKDTSALKTASKNKTEPRKFFSQALTILEAKYWDRRLNDSDKTDILDSRDPTAQTVKYLEDVHLHTDGKINWAILTNGNHWRLFYHKAASRSGNFFEIDLEEIITSGDAERFLYFYLFFSKDAFIPDSVTGKTWLDQHLKGTEEYAVRVSTKLKDLIFDKVFEGLAEGFVHYRMSELSIAKETEDSKKDIFKGCLTLLYRMLFLLYAESRNLLPIEEDSYNKVSLSKLRKDIDNDIRTSGLDKMSKRSYVYWARLEGLSGIIANGDSTLNVPVYNGGLFETLKDSFLSVHKMPDPFLAEAIKLLTVDIEGEYIDYSSLSVRHLGDIYEGLLEFHVQIAEEEMAEVKEKGKLLWKKALELKDDKIISRKQKGEVYIENSKHERKVTGSYYTPHYIVEYIVKNTVGSVLDEKLKTATELLLEHEASTKALHKQSATSSVQAYRAKIREIEDKIFDSIFGISVLDPAMGSGHFLVHTVDFISDRIVSFLAGYPENPVIRKIHELRNEILAEIKRQGVRIDESKLTEVNLIKRMVMKRCIYGVDLNDMAVELAKLSLWLDSFTLGAPLSFLDHHLKCGNSLIGTNIEELEKALTGYLFAINLEPLKRAIRDMIFVSDLPDATVEQVRESYKKFGEANKGLEGYRILLDMLIAEHFGVADAKKMLVSDFDKIDLNNLHGSISRLPDKDRKLIESAEAITKEKKFFHWEIEFPEVFYERTAVFGQKIDKKENSGFNCVIGNPPYVSAPAMVRDMPELRTYLDASASILTMKWDIYCAFIAAEWFLLADRGSLGIIIPTQFLYQDYAEKIRALFARESEIRRIVDLGNTAVFDDAMVMTCVFCLDKNKSNAEAKTVAAVSQKRYLSSLESISEYIIPQRLFIDLPHNIYRLSIDQKAYKLIQKLIKKSYPLEKVCYGSVGVVPHSEKLNKPKEDFIFSSKVDNKCKRYIEGKNTDRYSIIWDENWLQYDYNIVRRPSLPELLETEKIILKIVAGKTGLNATFDPDCFYTDHSFVLFTRKCQLIHVKTRNLHFDNEDIKLSEKYDLKAILAMINSTLIGWFFESYLSSDLNIGPDDAKRLPIRKVSFTTPEKERKKRVSEAIELYKKYMVELDKGYKDEKTKISKEHSRAVEDDSLAGGKKKAVSGKHPGAGKRVYGVRGRARKPEDAERISEESEEYGSTRRYTRYIESSLGIKSYSELAPHLAKGVERVMASLLEQPSDEIRITPEFICKLHKDAFEELFPAWAGRYRDRNVTVGAYNPPPYYEVPILIRQYCDDVEFRLSSLGMKPQVDDTLFEALAFAEGRFLSIHPFLDFNGRVTRMLLFALLYRFDLPPVQLVPDEKDEKGKKEYLDALSKADSMDWQPLMEVWRKRFDIREKE